MSNVSLVTQSTLGTMPDGREPSLSVVSDKPIDVKLGSTIQGVITSILDTDEGKMASIDLGNGTINARLSDGMGLREGQLLNFLVRGNSGKGVSITPLFENLSPDQSTIKALSAAGLELSNDNVQMVKEMMEAGLPIDKESLLAMSKNLNAYPNTAISTLVEMKSLNIPITANNIEQYTNYKNYEHQVLSDMSQIMDELPDAFNELMQSGNDKEAVNLYGKILNLFAGENSAEAVSGELQNANNAEGTVVQQNAANEVNAELSGKVLAEADKSGVVNAETAEAAEIANKEDAPVNSQGNRLVLSKEFVQELKNLNVSTQLLDKLSGNQLGSQDMQKAILNEISKAFNSSDITQLGTLEAFKKLFSSDEFSKLLKDNIQSQWLIKPDDVENKENVDKLYQRLGNQAKALSETINNAMLGDSKIGQAVNNLNNNLDFMNQLNQMFQYVQLPLQMAGQNAHGDLYVYKNRNKRMSEDGSVSAILHLDMDNLGPVDVYVKMLDTKVTTNFYVADDEVLSLINDNIHILNERLEKRGYSMNVNLMLHDDLGGQDAAVDEMLNVTKNTLLSTASFDARA